MFVAGLECKIPVNNVNSNNFKAALITATSREQNKIRLDDATRVLMFIAKLITSL
jgi:hypothetical protein